MKEGIQTNVLCTEVNNSYQISNFIFDKNLKMNKPYTGIMIFVFRIERVIYQNKRKVCIVNHIMVICFRVHIFR